VIQKEIKTTSEEAKHLVSHSCEVLRVKLLSLVRNSSGKFFQIALKYKVVIWRPIQRLKTLLKTPKKAALVL